MLNDSKDSLLKLGDKSASRINDEHNTTNATIDEADMFNPNSAPPSNGKLLKIFTKVAGPNILTGVLSFLSNVTLVVYAGRMDGSINVAVVGLAGTCIGIMIFSLMIGLNAAQETLTSQAFGAVNLRLCGIYLNRGTCVLATMFIPMALIPSLFAEQIFNAIGQDPEVSRLAATQMRWMLPGIFLAGQSDLRKRWLACQRITFVPMVANIIATFLFVPICYLFVYTLNCGLIGLAYASFVKEFIIIATTVLYCHCREQIRVVMQPYDCEAFRGWGEYLQVSLPATAMICAEWWAFEALTIMAGILGVTELASQTISLNMLALLFMVPLGIQEATCGLIGNCIGANNVPLAKRFFAMILKVTLALIVLMAVTTILARRQITNFFTDDQELIAMTTKVMIVVGCNFFADGLQGFLQGPIRAMGLQKMASYMALACYWLLGLPLSALFSFKFEFGVAGLLGGFLTATALQSISYMLILLRTDWQDVADKAVDRIKQEEAEVQAAKDDLLASSDNYKAEK